MSKQGRKANKIDINRLIPAIIALVLIIVVIVMIVKAVTRKSDNISLNGESAGLIEKAEMINKLEAEYDGNPYNVPETFTTTESTYVGEESEELSVDEISNVKNTIINKFKSYSPEELGINCSMDNVRMIFNTGTTTIADTKCLVFNVYSVDGEAMQYVSKFAMSIDGNTLYKFDSQLFVYRMIGQ